jgi:hypothetical protein
MFLDRPAIRGRKYPSPQSLAPGSVSGARGASRLTEPWLHPRERGSGVFGEDWFSLRSVGSAQSPELRPSGVDTTRRRLGAKPSRLGLQKRSYKVGGKRGARPTVLGQFESERFGLQCGGGNARRYDAFQATGCGRASIFGLKQSKAVESSSS